MENKGCPFHKEFDGNCYPCLRDNNLLTASGIHYYETRVKFAELEGAVAELKSSIKKVEEYLKELEAQKVSTESTLDTLCKNKPDPTWGLF